MGDKEIISFIFFNFCFFLELCPFFVFPLYILCICLLSGYRSQFVTWKLNFWYEETLALDEEKIVFSFFNLGFFSRVMSPFSFFPYIFFVFVCYQPTGHNFLPGNLIFLYEDTLALDEEIIDFSYLNSGFFSRVMSLF